MTGATPGLHPAQNRGLRELYSAVRQLAEHWTALADRLDGEPGTLELGAGADAARTLLVELADVTASYGLYGGPAAQGVGSRAAGLRTAVLDVQHVTTLLAYLAQVARAGGDEPLAETCGRWERRLRRLEARARKAAILAGADPDAAIAPLDRGALGRAGHRAALTVGTVGEWIDRRVAGRR